MAERGWYSDPGGQPGMYRYWDGSTWSDALSPTPSAPPPTFAYTPMYGQGTDGQGVHGQGGYTSAGGASAHDAYQEYQQVKTKKSVGPWIIVGVVAVALVVLIALVIRSFLGSTGGGGGDNPTLPTGNNTVAGCPKEAAENVRADHPNDGRVHGGKLSYPKLGSPWSSVVVDDKRIPFGRDAAEQVIIVHENPQPSPNTWGYWSAAIMIGELYAGDGFYAPEEASQIVNKCIFGMFYGNTKVDSEVLKSEPYSLGGHNGWITVTNLSFSIKNLPTTSELVTVIILQTSQMSSSIFYSSIPGDFTQYNTDVDYAIANLQVDP